MTTKVGRLRATLVAVLILAASTLGEGVRIASAGGGVGVPPDDRECILHIVCDLFSCEHCCPN